MTWRSCVTLYLKVTWPYKWPFLSRLLWQLEPWSFLFLRFFVREVNCITIKCVAFILDLVCQGHKTIQLTFPITGTMRAGTIIFFVFSYAFWVRKVNGISRRVARISWRGVQSLKYLHPSPTQLGGLGERCKLPQRGLGRSPSRQRFWCILDRNGSIWCYIKTI